jgi:hypothetical protein
MPFRRVLIVNYLAETTREYIDSLFNFALVFLALLSAAEFQYVLSVSKDSSEWTYMLRVSIIPFLILIPTWLVKEALKNQMSRRLRMFITEFCWEYWAFTLFYYLLIFVSSQNLSPNFMNYETYLNLALAFLLVCVLELAYSSTYRGGAYQDMIEFYRRKRFIIYRTILFVLTYVIFIVTLLPKFW